MASDYDRLHPAYPPGLLARLEVVEAALQMTFDAVRKLRAELLPGPLTPTGLAALQLPQPQPTLPALQVVPPDSHWIPILHCMTTPERVVRPCGQVGLYLTEPPREHEKARLDRMRILVPGESRWREPTINDEPRCSSCSQRIDPFSNADLDYLSRMVPGGARPPALGKRRDRKKSGGERSTVLSPGMAPEPVSPSTFPGHTHGAQQEVLQGIEALTDFARKAGLFNDRRLD